MKPPGMGQGFGQCRLRIEASLDFHMRVLPLPTHTNPAKSARFLLFQLMIALTYFFILHMPTSLSVSQGFRASRPPARFFQDFSPVSQLLVNCDLSRSINWI
jgi:hypothetical protein